MISQAQVTALTAQAAKAASYPAYDANGNLLPDWYINDFDVPVYAGSLVSTRGVGVYGQTPENLVLVELLKPASLSLIVSPSMTITVLNTSSVWTGLLGINSLADYLNAAAIQNIAQISLYEGAYQGLIDTGIIDGTESPRYIATFLQPSVRYGVDAVVAWVKGQTSGQLATLIQNTARQGQYAIDFVDTYGAQLNVAPALGGFENTVIRDELDEAVTDIIGNPKIPDIEFADQIPAGNVARPLSGTIPVTLPTTTKEDGTLRLAPNSERG